MHIRVLLCLSAAFLASAISYIIMSININFLFHISVLINLLNAAKQTKLCCVLLMTSALYQLLVDLLALKKTTCEGSVPVSASLLYVKMIFFFFTYIREIYEHLYFIHICLYPDARLWNLWNVQPTYFLQQF